MKKHKNWLNRLMDYFVNKSIILFRIFAVLIIIVLILTIVDTIGLTYKPKITIDAYNTKKEISSSLFGYGTSSDFQYNSNLVNAVNSFGTESFRIVDGFDPGARMLVKIDNGVFKVLAADDVPYENGREYSIKAEASGSRLKISVDGEQIFNVTDSAFSKGKIGLLTSYNKETYFDDVRVKNLSSGQTIFQDNFNSGASSSWVSNFYPMWYQQGSWYAESGEYKHLGKQNMDMKIAGSSSWQNYSYDLKMKSQTHDPYERGYMGITFRQQQEPLSSYRFMWRSDINQPYASNIPWGVKDFEGQLRFARETGSEPIVTVNMRDTASSAANLVRELNIKNDYNVKYWELGNEVYIWGDDYMSNTVYAEKIKEFSKAMKKVDPSIKIGASMIMGLSDWEVELLKRSADYIDFLIYHFYPYWLDSNISDPQLLAEPHAFGFNYKTSYGDNLGIADRTKEVINKYAPHRKDKIELVITEYNTGSYEKGISLVYGLTVADLLGQFAEGGVKFGQFHCLAPATEYHWAAFTSDYRPKPAALAISIFSKHFGKYLTPTKVTDSPTFSVSGKYNVPSMGKVPYLTAYSSRNKSNDKLYLIVVNKHSLATMQTKINVDNAKVSSKAKVYTMNGPAMNSNNNLSDQVKISESSIANAGTNFTYSFPAHSVTAFEFDINLVKPKAKPKTDPKKTSDNKAVGGTKYSNNEPKIAAGAGFGGNPHVKAFGKEGFQTKFNQFVYGGNFRGGASVALGDVDGDGKQEIIVGTGKGGGPQVRVFKEDGRELANFFVFHPDFHGGINVAAGDVDYDGKDEVVVSQASHGQAWVKVYRINSALPVIGEWNAYAHVECGGDVAMGDIDNDGQDEIIVGAGSGGGPHIRVFEANGTPKALQFFAFHPHYRGGVSVAAGDINGDGKAEIGVAQSGDGEQSWTKIYYYDDAKTIAGEWKAFGDALHGADIAMGDLDNDKKADIIASPTLGGQPVVHSFKFWGEKMPLSFYVFDPAFTGGLHVDMAK